MTYNKSLLAILAIVTFALIATVATATYASSMMTAQRNDLNHEMSEEQCESMMENMHSADDHSSMTNNSDHNGMMNANDVSGMGGMHTAGSGGCH